MHAAPELIRIGHSPAISERSGGDLQQLPKVSPTLRMAFGLLNPGPSATAYAQLH